jgi:tRNA pseudouridine65 synthase
MSLEPAILYQDDFLLAIAKPPGWLVHPTRLDRYERQHLMGWAREATGRWVYPVHRLDKPTSGLLLLAFDSETARRLSEAFAGRQVAKTYLAMVRGYTPDQLTIDYPLKRMHDKTTDRKARPDQPPQPAVTSFETLARVELPFAVGRYPTARYSLLCLQPETGRQRQLRRHLKHIFHPIVGDRKHGDHRHNLFFETQWACRRMLLHALALQLPHPVQGHPLTLLAPPDSQWQALLKQWGWQGAVEACLARLTGG